MSKIDDAHVKRLAEHTEHYVTFATYGWVGAVQNATLECLTCGCVLLDSDELGLNEEGEPLTLGEPD